MQILRNKAAKIIKINGLSLYSSASEALTNLSWVTLEQRRFYHRCLFVYKCVNGYTDHSMDLLTVGDAHAVITREIKIG